MTTSRQSKKSSQSESSQSLPSQICDSDRAFIAELEKITGPLKVKYKTVEEQKAEHKAKKAAKAEKKAAKQARQADPDTEKTHGRRSFIVKEAADGDLLFFINGKQTSREELRQQRSTTPARPGHK